MADISSEHFTHSHTLSEPARLNVYQNDEGIFIDSAESEDRIGTVNIRLSVFEACDLARELVSASKAHGRAVLEGVNEAAGDKLWMGGR